MRLSKENVFFDLIFNLFYTSFPKGPINDLFKIFFSEILVW